jgi:hypothetical protein
MNNPMSQMADAQKLTITQLQQSLRNGTIDPQVGQLVLNAKINEDKKRKAALAAQMPKQPPVAQQNMAYNQGVDTLASNLPTVSAAQGGIISFEEGGEVIRAANGLPPDSFSAPGLSQADVDYSNAMNASFLGNPTFQQTAGTILSPGISSFNYLADKIGGTAWVRDPKTGKLVRKSDLPQATAADKQAARLREQQAGLAQREAYNKKQQEARILANPAQLNGPYAPDMNPEAMAAKQAQMLQNRFAPTEEKPVDALGGAGAGNAGAGNVGARRAGNQGIADGYKIQKYDDSEFRNMLTEEMNPATGKAYTYAEKAAERLAQLKELGYDPDALKNQKADLEKRKEKSAERSKLDEASKWFAASEAFARQPKAGEAPQSNIAAITGALGAYGKTAVDLDEKELARQDKIRTEGNALALAMNADVQAQFSGNKADLKESQNAIKAIRTSLANLGIKDIDQQNEVAKEIYKANVEMAKTQMSVDASMYSADRAQNTINNIASAIQADAAKAGTPVTKSEAIKKAYEISNPGFAAIGQRDVDSQRDALNAQLKLISPFDKSPAADARRKQITAALNALTIAGSSGAPVANAIPYSQLNPG